MLLPNGEKREFPPPQKERPQLLIVKAKNIVSAKIQEERTGLSAAEGRVWRELWREIWMAGGREVYAELR